MLSVEERKKIVEPLLNVKRVFTKPLKPGTCKNRVIDGCCCGYSFQIDNLEYRGIWMSTLEEITLFVDGEEVPKTDMLFKVHGLNIPVTELIDHSYVFWWAEDPGIVSVNKVGGLSKGDHTFRIVIRKRPDFGHSYDDGPDAFERAVEFHQTNVIEDECVYTIE